MFSLGASSSKGLEYKKRLVAETPARSSQIYKFDPHIYPRYTTELAITNRSPPYQDINIRLDIIHMNMENAPNRYQSDRLIY